MLTRQKFKPLKWQKEEKGKKNFRSSTDLNPGSLNYEVSALPTELILHGPMGAKKFSIYS